MRKIELKRTYRAAGLVDDSEEWGEELWRYIAGQIDLAITVERLKEPALIETMRHRVINYVVSRLIVGGCLAIKPVRQVPDLRQEPLQQVVEDLLDVGEVSRDHIVWYLDRICPRILSGANALSGLQINSIRRFASERNHRCYLCGRVLHYEFNPYGSDEWPAIEDSRAKRSFEIEHIWNQARGGQKNLRNLAASCNECNKLKRELISPDDLALESFIGRPSRESSIKSFASKELRFALAWYQNGQCATCARNFYELDEEAVVIALREQDQPHHFFNMMICCLSCNEQKKLSGVKIRESLQSV